MKTILALAGLVGLVFLTGCAAVGGSVSHTLEEWKAVPVTNVTVEVSYTLDEHGRTNDFRSLTEIAAYPATVVGEIYRSRREPFRRRIGSRYLLNFGEVKDFATTHVDPISGATNATTVGSAATDVSDNAASLANAIGEAVGSAVANAVGRPTLNSVTGNPTTQPSPSPDRQ